MKTSYSITLTLLYLSSITCNSTNIANLTPLNDSNIDVMVSEIKRMVTAIESNRIGKASFIKIILPTIDENSIMPEIIEKIVQKLGTNWIINTNDSFCCDSYDVRPLLPQKPPVVEYPPDFYIIPLREHEGLHYLDAQLNIMSEENSFNPRAIFLLVTLTSQCGEYQDKNLTTPYFDRMWKENCMALVILVLSKCDFKITIITATPFSDNNICRKVQENGTKQYDSKWNDKDIDINMYKIDNKNFNKCPFSVGTIPAPPYVVGKLDTNAKEAHYDFVGGIDLELLHLVSTVYNFTYVFDVHHGFDADALSILFANGTMAGIFQDVLQKKIDISVGGIIPYDYNYYRYSYTSFYKFSSFVWAVNDARLAPPWKIFFGAFSQDVWIISGFVFVITSLLYSFLDRFVGNYHTCIKTHFWYCNFQAMPLIQYFSITLGLSSMLKPKSPCLRVLYFSWNIYSLHMCIAYSSMLFLLMSNPPMDKKIETVDDLKNSGLRVGSKLMVFQRFMFADLDITTKSVMHNYFLCPSYESCIEDLSKHGNFSLLIMQDMLEYYVNSMQSKVHRIPETFFGYSVSVMAGEGNPLVPRFDEIVILALQSGLIEKWDRDTKLKYKKVQTNHRSTDTEKKTTVLTISDLKGTFFVLAVGLTLSLLLLLCELLICFLQRNDDHKQALNLVNM